MGDTGCIVVGGGPAGLVLGLLLARAGVEVTVLEKHADFLRDFRGDTVHASTLTLLDELGLGERFAALPQRRMDRGQVHLGGSLYIVADLGRLPGAHQHIALVPQWDFLELLASAAAEEPSFTLRRNAEVTRLTYAQGRVVGVGYRDRVTGAEHELRAGLVVACDGRDSTVRAAAGLRPRTFGAPIDVEWFRLPRADDDPAGTGGWVGDRQLMIMIDRGDYWQCGYVIGKDQDGPLRAAGIAAFRARLAALVPWLGDRAEALASFDDVKLLNVRLERLPRWYAAGLLLIGDAAHAMSPVGGVGINLAVQDAVAAARILGPVLRAGSAVTPAHLRAVQRRRAWPAAAVQAFQRVAHARLAGPQAARVDLPPAPPAERPSAGPVPLRLLSRFPVLQGIPARALAIGPRAEHAPDWARRPGYVGGMPSTRWTADDIPDQSGRHVVITGGNSGIGFEAARMLAGAGARVTLAVRDVGKGARAAAEIAGEVDVRELDLSRLDSVRAFAAGTTGPIDVLVNNAGVMVPPFSRTAEGFEIQFGVNHLGPFALTNLLLGRITDRVVTVSSGAHRMGQIDLGDLNWERRSYRRWAAYGQSKLANLLFTLELERRLTAVGSPVRALAAHPGYSATNLQFHYGNQVVDRSMAVLNRLVGQSAAMGALPTVYAVTQDLPGGSYVGPDGRSEMRGYPTLVGRTAAASDVGTAERLWTASEELTGIRFSDEITAA